MNWKNKRKVHKKLSRNFFMEALARELDEECKKQVSERIKEGIRKKKMSTR